MVLVPATLGRRVLVVGDVHGCLAELGDLLKTAGYTAEDQLILAGDLVAKGPESAGVVALARELGALAVLGNHDAHLLAVRNGRRSGHAHRAVASSLTPDDWRYLERLPLLIDVPEANTLVVHAGLLPGVSLESQDRDLLLTLRSFDADGRPSKRSHGGTPWAARWPGPRFVVFGHDAIRGLQRHPFALGLDTGCVYGGRLSAVWLNDRRIVQVPARRVWQQPGGD